MSDGNQSYVARVSAARHRVWQGRGPLLGSLDLELTERCNNDCIHCCINLPMEDVAARRRELDLAHLKEILAEVAALGALSVRLTGGEPLLREDFIDLYLCARRLGLKVRLFTNARLITPELADLFARIPPLEKIEVTVYGMGPQS
jgi:MoaA/NifB/PqqE/SkfB family radical SAM enzyme